MHRRSSKSKDANKDNSQPEKVQKVTVTLFDKQANASISQDSTGHQVA